MNEDSQASFDLMIMNHFIRFIALILLSSAAWLSWQDPAQELDPRPLRITIPASKSDTSIHNHWRLISQRVVTKEAVHAMQKALDRLGVTAILIEKKERITLHAFDAPQIFDTKSAAIKAMKPWLEQHIDASIIKTEEGKFLVALGRFYQTKYAEEMQQQLRQKSRHYRYEKRALRIPTWRFVFPATDKEQALSLWKTLHNSGLFSAAMISEDEFQHIYGKQPHESLK